MSVSAIASNNLLNQTNSLPNTNQQQRTEFQQLTQALQSGNLTNARQAFGALTSNATNSGVLSVQLKQELGKLGSALQSGSLTSARQAYSSVQKDLQNPNPVAAHHHRPHHGLSRILTSGFPDSTSGSGSSAASQSDISQSLSLTA